MYKWKFFILFVLTFFTVGCLYDAEEYVYKESQNTENVNVIKTGYGATIYEQNEYQFFPSFYTLTHSYSNADSYIVVSSRTKKSIYINNIVIESFKGTHTDQVTFERVVKLDRYNVNKVKNYVSLNLFSEKNTDLKKYWSEGDIKVTLNYEIGNGKKEKIIFEFKLLKSKKIAMP